MPKTHKREQAKDKLASLLTRIEKKQQQIERKTQRLRELKKKVAKLVARNPDLKAAAGAALKSAGRSRRKRSTS